jgi:hypothetical protein
MLGGGEMFFLRQTHRRAWVLVDVRRTITSTNTTFETVFRNDIFHRNDVTVPFFSYYF